jgi:nitroimidazol reductase NimA-like FMN-containing flavoprotein (pyridoxamine 5'-phosphate oxidase superfamily)
MVNMLEKINALILRKDSCVLATTDGKTPHCSLIAYIPDESGERLYLVTSSASRKYQNIRCHPRVSLLIDARGDQQRKLTQAVTVTGTCEILQDTAKIARVKADFVRQHAQLDDFIRKDDVAAIYVQIDFFLLLEGPERAHYQIPDRRQPIG